jgi:hypothetical protein
LRYPDKEKERMSRLIDKFQKAAKSSIQPMGFRTASTTAPEPGILLIVSGTPEEIKGKVHPGKASAVLIRRETPVTAADIKKTVEAMPDIPVGLYAEDADDEEAAALAGAGCDFLVFPASSRISGPEDKKTGRILQVESAMDDSLLRAVNSLPVDAVMAADTFSGGAMSWHELMIFQHLANSFNKPLIVNIPPDIKEAELKALWEAGADAVVADASGMKADEMKELEKQIEKLPPRSRRKRGKVDALLPRAGEEAPSTAQPPDEEEEDE